MGQVLPFKRPRKTRAKRNNRSLSASALAWSGLFAVALLCAAISQRDAIAASVTGPSATPVALLHVEAGHLRVIDGDTLELRATGERIRIANIDTPEISEPRCAAERRHGLEAKARVQALLARASAIELRPIGREDRYGRTLARVRADGRDLGGELIRDGLARPWRGRREPWCDASGALRT